MPWSRYGGHGAAMRPPCYEAAMRPQSRGPQLYVMAMPWGRHAVGPPRHVAAMRWSSHAWDRHGIAMPWGCHEAAMRPPNHGPPWGRHQMGPPWRRHGPTWVHSEASTRWRSSPIAWRLHGMAAHGMAAPWHGSSVAMGATWVHSGSHAIAWQCYSMAAP